MWSFNPKNVTIDSSINQNKSPSFRPIGQKCSFYMRNHSFEWQNNFLLKMGIFWPMGQESRWQFWFWSIPEPMASFLGLKHHTSPWKALFWNTLYRLKGDFWNERLSKMHDFFAGIGFSIGHELSHAFDDHGRKYNGFGDLESWWTQETLDQELRIV